jgi:hypothetical protein
LVLAFFQFLEKTKSVESWRDRSGTGHPKTGDWLQSELLSFRARWSALYFPHFDHLNAAHRAWECVQRADSAAVPIRP